MRINITKSIFLLMIVTAFSKILGFLREVVMSYYYGATYITDAFSMANSSAGIFFGWVAVLSIMHTPFFQEIKELKDKSSAQRFTNQLVIIILLIGGIGLFLLFPISSHAISIVATGFSTEMIEITSIFFRWILFGLLITAINQVWISELNCRDQFISANATNLILSLVQIIIVAISGYIDNFMLLKVSQPLAVFIQLILLVLLVFGKGRTLKLGTPFIGEFKRIFVLIIPIFIVTISEQLNAFVDKMFASGLVEGSISSLNYAHMVKQLFFFVFATAVVTILYPKVSESISRNNILEFKMTIVKGIQIMMILFVPITLYVMTFSNIIISFVYERGAFDTTATKMTSESLTMYGFGLLPLAIREVLIKGLLAMQNTKANMSIAILSTVINIVLNFLLIENFQHIGLALSTSLTAYITLPILYLLMSKKIDLTFRKGDSKFFVKILFSSILGMIVILVLFKIIQLFVSTKLYLFISLVIISLIGALIYLFLLKVLKVKVIKP